MLYLWITLEAPLGEPRYRQLRSNPIAVIIQEPFRAETVQITRDQ
jgi:hypothetical protein